MGCVLSAGLGQAPARQAALGAGIPASIPATTVNKMCGSAMRAVMLAADQILAGSARIIVAGGLESMTNAPYLLPKARAGYRMGHQEVLDHMFFDGLQSPWDGQLMGCFAEATSRQVRVSRRQAQDEFATESVRRAKPRVASGAFAAEVAPGDGQDAAKARRSIDKDETPGTLDVSKIPTLKPAFKKDGTVTAASSAEYFRRRGRVGPDARILGQGAGPEAAGAHPGLYELRAGAGMVHARARGRDPKLLTRLEWRAVGRRSVRGERGVCGGGDGGHEGLGARSREGERERRRLCARTSDRRDRRAHPDHADSCAAAAAARSAALRACASAVAKRRPSPSN